MGWWPDWNSFRFSRWPLSFVIPFRDYLFFWNSIWRFDVVIQAAAKRFEAVEIGISTEPVWRPKQRLTTEMTDLKFCCKTFLDDWTKLIANHVFSLWRVHCCCRNRGHEPPQQFKAKTKLDLLFQTNGATDRSAIPVVVVFWLQSVTLSMKIAPVRVYRLVAASLVGALCWKIRILTRPRDTKIRAIAVSTEYQRTCVIEAVPWRLQLDLAQSLLFFVDWNWPFELVSMWANAAGNGASVVSTSRGSSFYTRRPQSPLTLLSDPLFRFRPQCWNCDEAIFSRQRVWDAIVSFLK